MKRMELTLGNSREESQMCSEMKGEMMLLVMQEVKETDSLGIAR